METTLINGWQVSNPRKYNIGQKGRLIDSVLSDVARWTPDMIAAAHTCADKDGFVTVKRVKDTCICTVADIGGFVIPYKAILF